MDQSWTDEGKTIVTKDETGGEDEKKTAVEQSEGAASDGGAGETLANADPKLSNDPPTGDGESDTASQEKKPEEAEQTTDITCSGGMAHWLLNNKCSLSFTSYQTGQMFLVGVMKNGSLSFHQRNFQRAMGLWADETSQSIYISSLYQIWRLENMLRPKEIANQDFDKCYIPRLSYVTGDVDAHDVGVESDGRVVFVNTSYSCLAVPDQAHSFRPLWKPPFISKLAPEDRCHLNGLAMENGRPRYVTAVCRSDVINGWRARRAEGGMIMDVTTDKVLTEKLSMPHSPRIYNGELYVLDSGRGQLCKVDRETGATEVIAFCPGFLRGLALHNNHAIIGLSLPRDQSFSGLELDDMLKEKDADPWCGVQVVDLRTGNITQWIRLEGVVRELFDVAVLPGVQCPMAVGFAGADIVRTITFEDEFAEMASAPS